MMSARAVFFASWAVLSSRATPSSPMPTRTIAPGVDMPIVSLGCGGGSESLNVTEYVVQWLAAGGRAIDTAYDYKDEPRIAPALLASGFPRSDFFITSKTSAGSYAATVKEVKSNLAQLQTPYLDLLLIHDPLSNETNAENWQALQDLKAQGLVRAIGVSNFDVPSLSYLLQNTSSTVPAVNQMEFFVGYHNHDDVIELCSQHGITYEAYSPLNKGQVLTIPQVVTIAARHNVSAAQIALRYVYQQQAFGAEGMVLTVQAHDPTYDAQDMDIFSFSMSDAEMQTLQRVNAHK